MHRFRLTLATAAILTLTGTAGASAAVPVKGSWQQLINCAFTRYNPLNGDFACLGASLWHGTWTGITHYRAHGTYDVLTGDSTGTLIETFHGHDRDSRRGTLTFEESYTLVGATSAIHIDTHIIDATGDFTHARGKATFDGTDNIATGFGTYTGRWSPPPLTQHRR
jgi:hypothetical protein